VGIPRALHFFEYFPYWEAFFTALGFEVVVSDPTNRHLIHQASERAAVEACFPVKVALGHVINLLEKEIDYLFMPSVITSPNETGREEQNSYLCPYVQSFPYIMRSVLDWQQTADGQGREQSGDRRIAATGADPEGLGQGDQEGG
jgi:predicted nucleotide-binding protein (sugar kinase/HSP70/actin superfamily)